MQRDEFVALSMDELQVLHETIGELLIQRISERNQELDSLLVHLGQAQSPTVNARRRGGTQLAKSLNQIRLAKTI